MKYLPLLLLACATPPPPGPITDAPVSVVQCFDQHGNQIFRHTSTERVHRVTRVGCFPWLRCCISDPWQDGMEDSRPWGIGFEGDTGESSAVVVDGVGVTCTTVTGYIP